MSVYIRFSYKLYRILPSGETKFRPEDPMSIGRRIGRFMVVALCCGSITPSQQAQSGSPELSINNVSLDVVVASKTGSRVAGLAQPVIFTVLDNGIPQAITSVPRGESRTGSRRGGHRGRCC